MTVRVLYSSLDLTPGNVSLCGWTGRSATRETEAKMLVIRDIYMKRRWGWSQDELRSNQSVRFVRPFPGDGCGNPAGSADGCIGKYFCAKTIENTLEK